MPKVGMKGQISWKGRMFYLRKGDLAPNNIFDGAPQCCPFAGRTGLPNP